MIEDDDRPLQTQRDIVEDQFMSKIAWTIVGTCPSGDHWIIDATIDGGAPQQVVIHSSELTAPITNDELPTILRFLLRSHATGKTIAQVKSNAQLGISVNL